MTETNNQQIQHLITGELLDLPNDSIETLDEDKCICCSYKPIRSNPHNYTLNGSDIFICDECIDAYELHTQAEAKALAAMTRRDMAWDFGMGLR